MTLRRRLGTYTGGKFQSYIHPAPPVLYCFNYKSWFDVKSNNASCRCTIRLSFGYFNLLRSFPVLNNHQPETACFSVAGGMQKGAGSWRCFMMHHSNVEKLSFLYKPFPLQKKKRVSCSYSFVLTEQSSVREEEPRPTTKLGSRGQQNTALKSASFSRQREYWN